MSRIVAGIYSGYGRNDMLIRTYDNLGKQNGWVCTSVIEQLYVYAGSKGYVPAVHCINDSTYYAGPPARNFSTALRRLNRVAKKINEVEK